MDTLRFQCGGDVIIQGGNFFELYSRRRMQFVTSYGRPFSDIAQFDRDLELGERLLHEPGIGEQLFFRLSRFEIGIGMLKESQRWQLIIPDQRSGSDS